jgi:hypothetical protein
VIDRTGGLVKFCPSRRCCLSSTAKVENYDVRSVLALREVYIESPLPPFARTPPFVEQKRNCKLMHHEDQAGDAGNKVGWAAIFNSFPSAPCLSAVRLTGSLGLETLSYGTYGGTGRLGIAYASGRGGTVFGVCSFTCLPFYLDGRL